MTTLPVAWESLGGQSPGPTVSAVSWGLDRLDLFIRGTADNSIYHKWFDAGSWQPAMTTWESLGGNTTGNVTAVSWGAGRLDLFYRGPGNLIYHKYFDSAAWGPSMTDWESLGGVTPGNVTAVSWGAGRLDIFVQGTDSVIYHKWFNEAWGPSMADWESLGGSTSGNVTAVSWGAGRLDLFYRGTDNLIYHKYFDSAAWGPSMTDWESLGGVTPGHGDVSAVSWGGGRLDVFVVGGDGVVYHKYFQDAWYPSMTDWESLGGLTTGNIAAVSWSQGRLDLFIRASDNSISYKAFEGGGVWQPSMTDWESLGGDTVLDGERGFFFGPDVSAVSWSKGRLDVFACTDSVYHIYYDGSWKPPIHPAAAPTDFHLISLSGTNVAAGTHGATVGWTDNANDEYDFVVIYKQTSTGDSGDIPAGKAKTVSFDLPNGYTYTIYVEAQNTTGVNSPSNSITVVVPNVAPPPQTGTVTLQRQTVVEGNIPYFGQFPSFGEANGHLEKISVPASTSVLAVNFVKSGHSTDECYNADAVVTVNQGSSTTADQRTAIYGVATPAYSTLAPVPFVACLLTSSINITPDFISIEITILPS